MKNLKVNKEKLMTLLLATTVSLSFSGCGKRINDDNYTMNGLLSLDEISSSTTLDEHLELQDIQTIDDLSIVDAVDRLDKYIDFREELDKIDFEGVDQLKPLTDEEYHSLNDLSRMDFKRLVDMAKKDENTLQDTENKILALKQLNYLNDYTNYWIKANGRNVSINAIMTSLKCALQDEYDMNNLDYSLISIPARYTELKEEYDDYSMNVNDENIPVNKDAEVIWKGIQYVYYLQDAKWYDDLEISMYKRAIKNSKDILVSGINIKNGEITTEKDIDYLNEKVLTK